MKPYLKQGICQKCSVFTYHYKLFSEQCRDHRQRLGEFRHRPFGSSPTPLFILISCVQVQNSVKRSESLNVWLLPNVYIYIYIYILYILVYHCGNFIFIQNPFLDTIKNPDMRTLYILKQGYRQKCRSCLKLYLGVQLLLCICVFSDVSRSFCSTENSPKGRTVVAPGD